MRGRTLRSLLDKEKRLGNLYSQAKKYLLLPPPEEVEWERYEESNFLKNSNALGYVGEKRGKLVVGFREDENVSDLTFIHEVIHLAQPRYEFGSKGWKRNEEEAGNLSAFLLWLIANEVEAFDLLRWYREMDYEKWDSVAKKLGLEGIEEALWRLGVVPLGFELGENERLIVKRKEVAGKFITIGIIDSIIYEHNPLSKKLFLESVKEFRFREAKKDIYAQNR